MNSGEDLTVPLVICLGEATAWVACPDPVLRPLLDQYFRHCLIPPEAAAAGDCRVDFRVLAVPEGWELWRAGERQAVRDQPYLFLETFMRELVEALITASQHQPVFHAAGVSLGGKAILLCGESGAGKSSLAAWLVSRGLDYLGDEVIALDPSGSHLSGLARPLVLKRSFRPLWQAWLGGNLQAPRSPFPDGLIWIDPDALRVGSACRSAHASVLVFPGYQAGVAFQAQPLLPGEAAFRLMQHLANRDNLPDRGMPAVAALARKTPAFGLRYGILDDAVWSWFEAVAV